MKNTEKKIKKIISQHLGVEEKEIIASSSLIKDLNASSLEVDELISKLESIFQVNVSAEDTEEFLTVNDIVTFFSENIDDA
ncbi:acyl carrier protein [Candidatus Microgenomates bacterium]|nr:acyl carrier protein [Candidatus Microgenomates bacterium]